MKILILIPVLNAEKDFFENILPRIKNQSVDSRIVLINSGDKIDSILNFDVININKKDFNHANTRNMILNFDADFFLFMTQDAKPFDDGMIEKLLSNFENKDVVVSYARQVPYENAHITEKFARKTNYPINSRFQSKDDIGTLGIKAFFCSDSCAMYRGSYFKEKGGFKKDLDCSEDMEFAARAILDGKRIAYCAEAKVYHSHVYSIKNIFDRYFLIGKFFKENDWIEKSLGSSNKTESTGRKQVLEEMKYIIKNKPIAIFKSVIYNFVKYIAYKRGKK